MELHVTQGQVTTLTLINLNSTVFHLHVVPRETKRPEIIQTIPNNSIIQTTFLIFEFTKRIEFLSLRLDEFTKSHELVNSQLLNKVEVFDEFLLIHVNLEIDRKYSLVYGKDETFVQDVDGNKFVGKEDSGKDYLLLKFTTESNYELEKITENLTKIRVLFQLFFVLEI